MINDLHKKTKQFNLAVELTKLKLVWTVVPTKAAEVAKTSTTTMYIKVVI